MKIDNISIESREQITELSRIINGLERADLSKYSPPDTRIKIEIFYNNKESYMCLDRFVISISDDIYILSESMLEYLDKLSPFYLNLCPIERNL